MWGLRGLGVRGSDILRAMQLEDYPVELEVALEVEARRTWLPLLRKDAIGVLTGMVVMKMEIRRNE